MRDLTNKDLLNSVKKEESLTGYPSSFLKTQSSELRKQLEVLDGLLTKAQSYSLYRESY